MAEGRPQRRLVAILAADVVRYDHPLRAIRRPYPDPVARCQAASNLDGANLEGAVFDAKTIWPDGFDPLQAGALLD